MSAPHGGHGGCDAMASANAAGIRTMATYRIATLVGSLRKDSFNRKLARAVERLAPPELAFEPLEIGDLPLYNQDDDSNPHPSVRRIKAQLGAAQGLFLVTPEYNRSVPGVLKNALDQASRPYGQNAWAGKPAGIMGISIGAAGTSMAQQHLRNMLAYLDVPTLAQPEVFLQMKDGLFEPSGDIAVESTKKFLQGWMNRYVDWVRRHNEKTQ